MLDTLNAIILGIVEGMTEFLPISSTAHLILASNLLSIPQNDFVKTFEIAIQSGAILAVVALYFRDFFNIEILKRIIVAFIPTGVVGLLLYKFIKIYLMGNTTVVLWALALGGILLIVFERFKHTSDSSIDISALSYRQCLTVGLCQSVAVIPGVSRSAATIVGGILMGIPRTTIVKFSFLLAVPTLAAATGLDLIKNAGSFDNSQAMSLTIGFIASFSTALIAVRWLVRFISRHTFISFGVYRLVVVMFFLFYLYW